MNEKQQKLIDASMLRPRTGETMPVDDYRVMMSLALELLADEPEAVASDAMPVNRFGRITEGCAPWMNAKQEELVGHAQATQFQVFTRKNNELVGVYDSEAFRYVVDRAIELLADEPAKELKDYTMAELAELVHDMAKEKGWWDAPREWPEIACLIHSEISEAVECYRNGDMALHIIDGKPEGLVVELADVLIRCLDYAAHVRYDDLPHETLEAWVRRHAAGEYGMLEHLHKMHTELACYEPAKALYWCMTAMGDCCKKFNLDLQSAVVAKIEYNAKRPYRHGGKRA